MVIKRGMSLIEIIIVLSIISIAASLAIPTFSETIQNYRMKSAILALDKDLRFAKYTANQKKTRVAICISENHTSCITTTSNRWHKGWIVFIDSDNNFTPKPENILRQHDAVHPAIKIISSTNIQHGVQFNTGKKPGKSLGSGLANGHFIICHPNQKNAHKLILNIYGRLRKEQSDTCDLG